MPKGVTGAPGEDEGPARRVGSIIKGKWTIESLLGVGGMATVYAAAHRNGQRAALKILHLDFARDKTICERFLREGYVSNKIGHRACVAVLDDDRTDDDSPFLVMELLVGDTVRDVWKKAGRRMQIPAVLKICDEVLDCLIACHNIGVIHRDLKPANIFVTKEGVTKVLDFGVAQMRSATSERTATGTALGTPAYMSPEQAMGLVDQLDGRADLFSVGAMIHALTTGQRINSGRTENEALVMAATTPVPSVARIAPDLPIELITLIDKSLAWDRRNRYADAREMQQAVRDVYASVTGSAPAAEGGGAAPAGRRAPAELEIPLMEGEEAPPPPPPVAVAAAPAPAPPPQPPLAPAGQVRRTSMAGMPRATVNPGRSTGSGTNAAVAAARASVQNQQSAPAAVRRPTLPLGTRATGAIPAQPVAVPAGTPEELRLEALRELFKRLDRLLPSVRQFGWQHPATDRTLHQTYDGFAEALSKDPDVVDFTIRPYSMLMGGQTVWEPQPPFDAIPYNLFACGMRSMKMTRGLTLEELKDTLSLMLLDPGRDLPPEDDIVAALWERGLEHVKYEVVDAFADGDAAEREAFYGESDELERVAADKARQAAGIEAKAMAVSTDKAALQAGRAPSPMAVEEVVRSVFARQLEMPRDLWAERYVEAMVEGYIDAAVNRDAPLVLASLRKSSADLVVAGRFDVIVNLHDAITNQLAQKLSGQNLTRLSGALTNAMFGAETLELVIKFLSTSVDHVPKFEPILGVLNAAELHTVLAGLRASPPPPLRAALLDFVARVLPGNEMEVATAATGLDADTVHELLSMVAHAGTQKGQEALALLAQSEDMNVRVEANVLASGSVEAASNELIAMCDSPQPLVRMAALRAITRYGVKGAWAQIARIANAKEFNDKGSDERRELLRALVSLVPDRGEPMALELAKKGGVFVSESREATRVAAVEALGAISRSPAVSTALREIAQARWGTSDETRAAAGKAADAITARLQQGIPPS
jgi:hypothetical protein